MIVTSNYKDEELIRCIEHEYPDLEGPLLDLLRRFEKMVEACSLPRYASLPVKSRQR